jgi:DUF1365 family protein
VTDKAFYVSPFFDVSGSYALRFALRPDLVSATVILRRHGAVAFTAAFRGRCSRWRWPRCQGSSRRRAAGR